MKGRISPEGNTKLTLFCLVFLSVFFSVVCLFRADLQLKHCRSNTSMSLWNPETLWPLTFSLCPLALWTEPPPPFAVVMKTRSCCPRRQQRGADATFAKNKEENDEASAFQFHTAVGEGGIIQFVFFSSPTRRTRILVSFTLNRTKKKKPKIVNADLKHPATERYYVSLWFMFN